MNFCWSQYFSRTENDGILLGHSENRANTFVSLLTYRLLPVRLPTMPSYEQMACAVISHSELANLSSYKTKV